MTIALVLNALVVGGLVGYLIGTRQKQIVVKPPVVEIDMRFITAALDRAGLIAVPKGVEWTGKKQ